ncbi:pentatricopeptide repeat-containing protein At1g43980, mitochondrial [Gastrolobium bilobum]|uniref:pentatricopeptide repeat-containing protein At1g43980, mitochondrial n=1 Tax=Gastrolobium bilobum TaxID=150636 RepID=UPI002AB19FCF|nr:pentatricopeptide repeat-containing protein At1g43980, mitochondrial [Gastrolobium bilobum]
MYPYLKQIQGPHSSLSFCSLLLRHCLSKKSVNFVKIVHAHFLKLGLNTYTYLGNRCLDLYFEFGHINDASKVFDDIYHKNSTSWNICLKGLLKSGQLGKACYLFDGMPVRDVVSWNSMISGYAYYGLFSHALELFVEMQGTGVRPSGFTFSIMTSIVSSPCHAKQIHGRMIRIGMDLSNVVLGNSLIAMYGKLGLVDYSFGVILTMEQFDVISWNSLIWACHRAGHQELALEKFYQMRTVELLPDQFTCSILMSVCSNLRDLDKGKQVFAFCFKMGFVYNSIVSSAAIDLFSKCNRLEDSIRLFKEQDQWDSALCNSMISSYARHDLGEDALQLFVLSLRENIRPTEYMVSCLLSSVSIFLPVEVGNQIHSLVPKLGFESDAVVANSLVDMYAKFGFIDDALNIFNEMKMKDLVSWNTIMMGLTYNGKVSVTMDLFKELIRECMSPDRITLAAVLLACNYGNLIDEGVKIFSSMEKEFGVKPGEEHCAYVVEMLSKAGKLKEAIDIVETMPYRTSSDIWRSILSTCAIHEDLRVIERVAQKIMEREPQISLPYLVLAQAYQMRGRWESMVRVRKAVEHRGNKEFIGCSWVGIKHHIYTFASNQLQHYGGKDLYLVLNLLVWEMETEEEKEKE